MLRHLALAGLLLWPIGVQAHGGVSKNAGSTIVFLNQNPLSPLTGEEVVFSFALTDQKIMPLPQVPVELTLIDTAFNDPNRDTVIWKQNFTTDANGAFEFRYKFDHENYFDLELSYQDPINGEIDRTGFLVEPRRSAPPADSASIAWVVAAVAVFVSAIITALMINTHAGRGV